MLGTLPDDNLKHRRHDQQALTTHYVRYQYSYWILDQLEYAELYSADDAVLTDRILGEGNLRRSTLTVSSSTGGFLIAFLALFVTLAMSQLWEIVCYCLHFWRSTPEERSAFHHQNQALLRSGSPAFSFAQKMMRILWAWKGVRGRGYKVGFGMVAFAVAFGTCTIVASLFSSQVTNTDSVVLVLPTHCGWPPHNHDEDNLIEALSLYIPGIKIFENSRAYAQKCYGLTAGPNGASCNFFVKPALERTIKRDIDCPFSPGICESKGITLTSGYIDSHEDLGINAAPEDRIRFRKSLSCAVLKAESNYSSEWLIQPAELQNISSPLYQSPGVAFKLYFLGSQIIQGVPAPYSFYFSNISSPRSGYQTQ